jgi:hypothetical protein
MLVRTHPVFYSVLGLARVIQSINQSTNQHDAHLPQFLPQTEPADDRYATAEGGIGQYVKMYRAGTRAVLQSAILECQMIAMGGGEA